MRGVAASAAAAWLLAAARGAEVAATKRAPVCSGSAAAAGGACSAEEHEGTNLLQKGKLRSADAQATASELAALEEELLPQRRPKLELTISLVEEIYSFGSPPTRRPALRNAASEDGCFDGLRSYTENVLGYGTIHQVDAGAMYYTGHGYQHAKMNAVCLHWRDHNGKTVDSIYSPCKSRHTRWPLQGPGRYMEWRLHHEYTYRDRLSFISLNGTNSSHVEPFDSARQWVSVAYRVYEGIDLIKDGLRRYMPGWYLIFHGVYRMQWIDSDPVMLVQDAETQDCALAFCGTNSPAEYSTSAMSYGTGFCGFDHIHAGYRNELWQILNRFSAQLKPKLETCNRVICMGHSLGGSLCEIFAACANSGNFTDVDYRLLAWNKSARMNHSAGEDLVRTGGVSSSFVVHAED